MNSGDVLSDSVRRSVVENSRATCAAWTSRSNRTSVWSQTKPIGTTRNLRMVAERSSITCASAGPSHGSGVRPALWNACSYVAMPAAAATSRAVAATSSA